ncbi:MAG: peptidylprolyl isomerase [Planktomarina sp.]|jgi:peptidyl-prolyl cis-trans isomerase C|nr:peptidylprolyl isomerase [Planktomarina sp.]
MAKFNTIFRNIAFTLFLSTPLAAQEANLTTVVATVNGTKLTLAHVLDIKRQLPAQYKNLEDSVLFNGIIEQLVQQQLLASSFETPPSWLPTAMENQERNLLSTIVIDDIRAGALSEAALQSAYDAKFPAGEGEEEYQASHILMETEDEAREILTLLDEGADFATLAQEHSTGPSGPRGGDLGWFGKGQMVPDFENAVLSMAPGAYAGPVQTQFGYHLILLRDRRIMARPSLEEVRGELEVELQNAAVESHLRALMDGADVSLSSDDIDPSVLSTLDQ